MYQNWVLVHIFSKPNLIRCQTFIVLFTLEAELIEISYFMTFSKLSVWKLRMYNFVRIVNWSGFHG